MLRATAPFLLEASLLKSGELLFVFPKNLFSPIDRKEKYYYNSHMQIWFIGRMLASQAGEGGSIPLICFFIFYTSNLF